MQYHKIVSCLISWNNLEFDVAFKELFSYQFDPVQNQYCILYNVLNYRAELQLGPQSPTTLDIKF